MATNIITKQKHACDPYHLKKGLSLSLCAPINIYRWNLLLAVPFFPRWLAESTSNHCIDLEIDLLILAKSSIFTQKLIEFGMSTFVFRCLLLLCEQSRFEPIVYKQRKRNNNNTAYLHTFMLCSLKLAWDRLADCVFESILFLSVVGDLYTDYANWKNKKIKNEKTK